MRTTKKRTIIILYILLLSMVLTACGASSPSGETAKTEEAAAVTLELKYATEFSAELYEDGYRHVHISDGTDYVIIPEGKETTDMGYRDAVIVKLPLESVYVAASASMDLILQLGAENRVSAVSTREDDWSVPEIRDRMENETIVYAGKYSAPDYELLLNRKCELAIESTMITHAPKIKEQLNTLGIQVLTEKSSYEAEPLGRLEWIKLYGILFSKEEEANTFFDLQCGKVEKLLSEEFREKEKRVAFFYLSSNGYVNIRKPGDYITKMIETAGGSYAFEGMETEGQNALSTININWEEFYRCAVDADILIYNSTVDGGIRSVNELIEKNGLFSDFKAVQEGNVWCTGLNMYQKTSAIADVISDLSAVIGGNGEAKLVYLNKAEG